MWGTRGEKLAQYLLKGKQVFVTGELSLRPYTSKEGVERLSVDVNVNNVNFVGSREDNQGGGSAPMQSAPMSSTPAPASEGGEEEDLPF